MKRALTLLFLVLSFPAYSQGANDDVLFKDYISLVKMLRAHGVEPNRVQWNPIEMMCLGFKEPASQVAYNRCRFAKAQDQIVFNDDLADCDDEAYAAYPKSMIYPRPAVVTQNTNNSDGSGKSTISTFSTPSYYPSEVISGRRAVYSSCMRDRGWVNPRNWAMGRR